jgi:hypothetical protein
LLEPVLVQKINEIVPINLEAMIENGDQKKFDERTHCYACEEQYPKKELFMDHCHATGKIFFYNLKKKVFFVPTFMYVSGLYRGPSCRLCNRRMYERKTW